MQGWIKLHRKILENPITTNPNYGWTFIVLLLKANHQDNEFLHGNSLVQVKRGQLVTGRKALAKEIGINENTLQVVLKNLEHLHMIQQQTNNRFRLITIVNYDKYQDDQQQNNNKITTNQQQNNTNKNVKKEKNEKNISTSKSKAQSSGLPSEEIDGKLVTPSVKTYSAPTEAPPKVSSNSELVQVLEAFNKATGKNFKSTLSWSGNFKKWRKEYSLDEIKKAIENIPNHSWFSKTPEAQKLDIFFRTNKDWIADCLQVKAKPKEVYFIPQNYE